jgi:hypothetical protein
LSCFKWRKGHPGQFKLSKDLQPIPYPTNPRVGYETRLRNVQSKSDAGKFTTTGLTIQSGIREASACINQLAVDTRLSYATICQCDLNWRRTGLESTKVMLVCVTKSDRPLSWTHAECDIKQLTLASCSSQRFARSFHPLRRESHCVVVRFLVTLLP